MSLIKAGGMDLSSEACKKALQAVGLDPEHHANYSKVNEFQGQARSDLSKSAQQRRDDDPNNPNSGGHVPPCTLGNATHRRNCRCHQSDYARASSREEDQPDFLDANGQSGHMSQNAFYQQPGARGDPCQNYPPGFSANGQPHGGTYGYDMHRARCMPHYGMSTQVGSPHHLITQTEHGFASSVPTGPVSADTLRTGTGQMAAVAVTGSRWDYEVGEDGQLRMTRRAEAEGGDTQRDFSQEQIDRATDQSYAASGAAATAPEGQDFDDLSDTEKQAIACLVAEWEKSLYGMQKEAISNYGPENARAQQRACEAYAERNNLAETPNWNDLSPAQQRQAVAARQDQLAQSGANLSPIERNSLDGHPSMAECREYQANWLWQQQQAGGGIPPMQGFNGNMPPALPAPPGTSPAPLPEPVQLGFNFPP